MCGINGFNWNSKKLAKEMSSFLIHRGPNSEGVYSDKNCSLSHKRLSIIDLSKKANQPMEYSYKRKKAIIVYNGEIYNFKEIKKDLIKKGYKFKTDSDTEVILASYFEYGEDCVKKFNGMWAFCIYDINKKILFLSRDRIGKKPLYYYSNKKKFIFSSEIKGILNHNLNFKLDKNSIDLYLSLGFIPSPYSIYQNISKLEPRQNLIYDLNKKSLKKYYYYDYPKYSPIYNKKELIKQGKNLLKNSVKLRLISDVPVGAFLSGGLDSSIIVSQMSDFMNLNNLNTFSIGFSGKYDESQYSNLIKNFFNTKHHSKYFAEKDFQNLLEKKNIFYYYDEPFSEHSMFPTFELSELTKKYVTVSLSGDGGDEIFGGYPRYQIARQLEFLKKIPKILREIMLFIFGNLPILNKTKIKEGLNLSLYSKKEFYSKARDYIYKPEITKKILEEKMQYCLELSKNNLSEAVRLMDIIFYTLPDRFLLNIDRASMANSLEIRCPFLDYRFLEYSMKIPVKLKVSKTKTKILMREIIKEDIPKKILNRKKAGFTPPLIDWINKPFYLDKLKNILEELYTKKIIDKNWYDFYNKILEKNEDIFKFYKIRLFLLWKWAKYWGKI